MLTDFQAYKVMFQFLDDIWSSRKNEFRDDFPSLLGDTSPTLFGQVSPAFPGQWAYWKRCATSESLTDGEGIEAMIKYLRIYQATEDDRKEISNVIDLIEKSNEESLKKWRAIADQIRGSD